MSGPRLESWIERVADGPARGSFDLPDPGRPGDLPRVGGLLAGAAEVDITPPPGLPKAGHSRNALDGVGFRTRLRARVLHLRSGRTSVALVAADIHAGSAVLHRLVADRIAAGTDIDLGGMFLGSTHTHAGPGQYHGCDFYNRWASNRAGLDPRYTDFLVDRISGAIVAAHESRRPARMATGATEVFGYTRNRSLSAHVLNRDVTDKRTGPARKYSAINPWLHLVRVDTEEPDGGMRPLAALAFFSIHGTGISRHDPAYNADVWAYITGEAAAGIERATGTRPVVGAVEGTHGDVTPAVRPGLLVYHEAERVGRGIGRALADLHGRLEGALTAEVQLGRAYREVDLAKGPVVAGVRLPDPAVGAAKLAGAVENTTPVLDRIPPFRAGFPKPVIAGGNRSGHGAKWVFGGRVLQHRVAPVDAFPRVLPVQLLKLNDLAVLGLPFEVTVEAGRHLRSVLDSELAGTVRRTVVSSAANDYWDYLTTPAEYRLQFYEGASTLYGPASLSFVAGVATGLARDLASGRGTSAPVEGRRFEGLMRQFMASASPAGRRFPTGPPVFVEATATEDCYWELRWSAGSPASLRWDRPLVRVEEQDGSGGWAPAIDGAGGPADDGGWHVGVVHLGPDGRLEGRAVATSERAHTYAARWYSPPLGRPGRWRFVLSENSGYPETAGDPFD